MTLRACLVCGEPTEVSRCPAHRPRSHKRPRELGYNAAWDRLSRRARRLQPFCTECGSTEDLQLDHSPEAWEARTAGKAITLQMVSVLCGDCNRKAGAARGENVRQR